MERQFWGSCEMEYLKEHYPHKTTDTLSKELRALFGTIRNEISIRSKANYLGLKKTDAFWKAIKQKSIIATNHYKKIYDYRRKTNREYHKLHSWALEN